MNYDKLQVIVPNIIILEALERMGRQLEEAGFPLGEEFKVDRRDMPRYRAIINGILAELYATGYMQSIEDNKVTPEDAANNSPIIRKRMGRG